MHEIEKIKNRKINKNENRVNNNNGFIWKTKYNYETK